MFCFQDVDVDGDADGDNVTMEQTEGDDGSLEQSALDESFLSTDTREANNMIITQACEKPRPPKKRTAASFGSKDKSLKRKAEDELIFEATKALKSASASNSKSPAKVLDEFDLFGRHVANEMRHITDFRARQYVKVKIQNELFEAQFNQQQQQQQQPQPYMQQHHFQNGMQSYQQQQLLPINKAATGSHNTVVYGAGSQSMLGDRGTLNVEAAGNTSDENISFHQLMPFQQQAPKQTVVSCGQKENA